MDLMGNILVILSVNIHLISSQTPQIRNKIFRIFRISKHCLKCIMEVPYDISTK